MILANLILVIQHNFHGKKVLIMIVESTRFDSHLLFEFDNLIANSDFEITGVSNCNGQDMYPAQWWIFPYC